MKILLIGDIVGSPGGDAVKKIAPRLRGERSIDLAIANAENVAGGSGLTPETVDELFAAVAAEPGYFLAVDLDQQQVLTPDRLVLRFEIDQFRKHCMLHGLDDIDLTLQFSDHIRVYEERRRKSAPWLFTVV